MSVDTLFVYNFATEYSQEDIKKVIKLEEEEQHRRNNDLEGEKQRKLIAHQVAELFTNDLRATWFQRGSSFVLSLLGTVRSAGDQVLNSQPAQVFNDKIHLVGQKGLDTLHGATAAITLKAGDIGLKTEQTAKDLAAKGVEVAGGLKDKSVSTFHDTTAAISNKAEEVRLQSVNAAQTLASDLKGKSIETAQQLKVKSLERASSAKDIVAVKISEYAGKLKDSVSNLSLFKVLGNLTGNNNLKYALLEMEQERAYRMNSSNEYYAIHNARKIAGMIKELDILYRPSAEPFAHYHTRLLEESERSRRVAQAQTDKAAIDNARATSLLIAGLSTSLSDALTPGLVKSSEEAERTRRVQLAQKDKAALDNARTVSSLIKDEFSKQPATAAM